MNPKSFCSCRNVALRIFAVGSIGFGVGALAQGTVDFVNHVTGIVTTHIYLGGDHQISGNGPNDYPPGTQDWTGFSPLLGTGYTAQLWSAPGLNQPESSLQPTLPTTTFYSVAAGAGFLLTTAVSLPTVPFTAPATVTMRVWDNRGGSVTSWVLAQSAGVASGESPLLNIPSTGGISTPPADLLGLVSFNIYQVPEPSALGLAGVGAFLLWWKWRLKGSVLE